jgi:hypothetical protein
MEDIKVIDEPDKIDIVNDLSDFPPIVKSEGIVFGIAGGLSVGIMEMQDLGGRKYDVGCFFMPSAGGRAGLYNPMNREFVDTMITQLQVISEKLAQTEAQREAEKATMQ